VVLDGRLVLACLTLAAAIPDGTEILTIEGLERTEIGRALQEAFLASGGVQCGCCAPGMLVASWALLSRNPRPTREEVRIALSGNLCRCTGYATIVDAVIACAGRSEGGS
jgi:carbon-monoxide dehydrogenase small subunit